MKTRTKTKMTTMRTMSDEIKRFFANLNEFCFLFILFTSSILKYIIYKGR